MRLDATTMMLCCHNPSSSRPHGVAAPCTAAAPPPPPPPTPPPLPSCSPPQRPGRPAALSGTRLLTKLLSVRQQRGSVSAIAASGAKPTAERSARSLHPQGRSLARRSSRRAWSAANRSPERSRSSGRGPRTEPKQPARPCRTGRLRARAERERDGPDRCRTACPCDGCTVPSSVDTVGGTARPGDRQRHRRRSRPVAARSKYIEAPGTCGFARLVRS